MGVGVDGELGGEEDGEGGVEQLKAVPGGGDVAAAVGRLELRLRGVGDEVLNIRAVVTRTNTVRKEGVITVKIKTAMIN